MASTTGSRNIFLASGAGIAVAGGLSANPYLMGVGIVLGGIGSAILVWQKCSQRFQACGSQALDFWTRHQCCDQGAPVVVISPVVSTVSPATSSPLAPARSSRTVHTLHSAHSGSAPRTAYGRYLAP